MDYLISIQTIQQIQYISAKKLNCKLNKLLLIKMIFIYLQLLETFKLLGNLNEN